MGRSHDSHMTCGRDHVTFVMMSSVILCRSPHYACPEVIRVSLCVCLFVCIHGDVLPGRPVRRKKS